MCASQSLSKLVNGLSPYATCRSTRAKALSMAAMQLRTDGELHLPRTTLFCNRWTPGWPQLTKPPPMSTVCMSKPIAIPTSQTCRALAMAVANAAGFLAPLPCNKQQQQHPGVCLGTGQQWTSAHICRKASLIQERMRMTVHVPVHDAAQHFEPGASVRLGLTTWKLNPTTFNCRARAVCSIAVASSPGSHSYLFPSWQRAVVSSARMRSSSSRNRRRKQRCMWCEKVHQQNETSTI